MSQKLTIELSNDLYAAIERQALEDNTSPTQIVLMSLEQYFQQGQSILQHMQEHSEAELAAARARFERHFGVVDLGYPTGVDNEHIDADLAREYADTHEEA